MKRKLSTALLIALLLIGTLPLFACGGNTTLARIAPTIAPLADILASALGDMKAQGVISAAKYDELMKVDPLTGLNLIAKIKDIGAYLVGVSVLTPGNRNEVLAKVREGIDLVVRVIGGLQPGSKGARALSAIKIALDAYTVAILLIMPIAPGVAAGRSVSVETRHVRAVVKGVDPEIARELKAKMKG